MTTQPTPAPGFRIERCGNLYVYIAIKPNDTHRKINEGVGHE